MISTRDFELQAPNLSGEGTKAEAKVQWAPQNLGPRGFPKIYMSIILKPDCQLDFILSVNEPIAVL